MEKVFSPDEREAIQQVLDDLPEPRVLGVTDQNLRRMEYLWIHTNYLLAAMLVEVRKANASNEVTARTVSAILAAGEPDAEAPSQEEP